jgi:hypothetical protein
MRLQDVDALDAAEFNVLADALCEDTSMGATASFIRRVCQVCDVEVMDG